MLERFHGNRDSLEDSFDDQSVLHRALELADDHPPAADLVEAAHHNQTVAGKNRIAETYFLEEKWQDAFLAYQKVYASYAYPEWQAAALMQSGKCDEQLGHWKEAAATYAQLITEFPQSPYIDEARRRQQQAKQRAGG